MGRWPFGSREHALAGRIIIHVLRGLGRCGDDVVRCLVQAGDRGGRPVLDRYLEFGSVVWLSREGSFFHRGSDGCRSLWSVSSGRRPVAGCGELCARGAYDSGGDEDPGRILNGRSYWTLPSSRVRRAVFGKGIACRQHRPSGPRLGAPRKSLIPGGPERRACCSAQPCYQGLAADQSVGWTMKKA